jgi:hypothetical protein
MFDRARALIALLAPLALATLAACAPSHGTAFQADLQAAARDEGAGRFEAAAERYDDAARKSTRPRDADQARWDAAVVTVHAGHVAEAVVRLEPIAADPRSEHQAEAAYRLAALRIESGDADRGWSRSRGASPRTASVTSRYGAWWITPTRAGCRRASTSSARSIAISARPSSSR